METGRDAYNFLAVIVIAQLVLLSVFLLVHKKGRKLSNGILAFFLSAKALAIINTLFSSFRVRTPHVYFVFTPVIFLLGPALYFYARSLAYKDFKLRAVHALNGVPFLLCALYFTLSYHVGSAAQKIALLEAGTPGPAPDIAVIYLLIYFQEAAYLAAALCVLARFRRELKSLYSSTEKISLSWLSFILFGFVVLWSVNAVTFTLWWSGRTVPVLDFASMIMLVVFYNAMVFRGLRQPEIFNGIEKQKKYEHSKLTEEEKNSCLARLRERMERDKPYLDPSLSLAALARSLSIPPRHLSQIINESLGMSFFDFINSYRVEEAKRLLRRSDSNGGNILSLLLEAGFQTKSVFNRVFKKHARMTPSEFRRQGSPESMSLG